MVFADFKYTRSFFDSAQAATPISHDAFTQPNGADFGPGLSVPIQNPFNPFTVADATLTFNGFPVPVTTGVRFRAINDEPVRTAKFTLQDMLFDAAFGASWETLAITSRIGIGNQAFVTPRITSNPSLAVL